MKNKEIRLFFSILRKSLWGGDLELITDELTAKELIKAINISKSQTVLCLVANEVITNESLSRLLNDDIKKKLTRYIHSNFLMGQKLDATIVAIVQHLKEHDITPILLKGQGIAKSYRIPELRQCGDIDIYVGKEKFVESCELISSISDSYESHKNDYHTLKHFHTNIGSVCIEVHRYTDVYFPHRYDLKYQKISDTGMNNDLLQLDFSGETVFTPSLNFNVFYIFNHFWHHFISEGVGLRQICDWVLLLHSSYGKINLDQLSSNLFKMKLMNEWKIFGWIAVNILGLPHEEMPFYDNNCKNKAYKVLGLILIEGNFGKENMKDYKRPNGYISGKWYSFKRRFKRNLKILRIFPLEGLRYIYKIVFVGIAVIFNDKFLKYTD